MKVLSRIALVAALAMTQAAWADTGPYYVSYPGYCNVKSVYVRPNADVYGTEIGCTSLMGQPLMGFIGTTGNVNIARYSGTAACMETYWANGQLTGGCSNGSSISYAPTATYSVREASRPGMTHAPQPADFTIGTEMPDLDAVKNLPARP